MAKLRGHAHIHGDPVTLADAKAFEHIGEFLHLEIKLAVGERAGLARLAFPQNGDFVLSVTQSVAIDAVVAQIRFCRRRTTWPREVASRVRGSTE